MGNFVFFVLIYEKLGNMIDTFSSQLMNRVMSWVDAIALVLVTLWILLLGFRILTGQLRESMTGVAATMARVVFIVAVSTSMTVFGTSLSTFLTQNLNTEINQLVTGNTDSIQQAIDKNLGQTEIAMSAIDAVQLVPGDDKSLRQSNHAAFFAGLGTSGPPITAAALLLMYRFALALFIGFGPLFILCLLFEQTQAMFRRWLMYGIATLFSMAALNAVTAIVLKLSWTVAAGTWTTAVLQRVFDGSTDGMTHQAMEQGGLGLILTLLIVTVPQIAGRFFGETLGNFMPYSAFGGGSQHRPQGQRPTSGYAPTGTTASTSTPGSAAHAYRTAAPPQADTIKTLSDAKLAAAINTDPAYLTARVGAPAAGTGVAIPAAATSVPAPTPTAATPAAPTPQVSQGSPSGASWVSQYPTSSSVDDLAAPFKSNVNSFISALQTAGATVTISATLRPPERAYLMHYAWAIVNDGADPQKIPPQEGVNINWVHTDANGNYSLTESVAAAQEMVNSYGMSGLKVAPALSSRHIEGNAIDMNISWSGTLSIADASNKKVTITSSPMDGMNSDLDKVGSSYGVIKFVGGDADKPHWSNDGH